MRALIPGVPGPNSVSSVFLVSTHSKKLIMYHGIIWRELFADILVGIGSKGLLTDQTGSIPDTFPRRLPNQPPHLLVYS